MSRAHLDIVPSPGPDSISAGRLFEQTVPRVGIIAVLASTMVSTGVSLAEGRGKSRTHVVEHGETLWEISRSYGCNVDQVRQANEMGGTMIRPGQKLRIPRCTGRSRRKAGYSGGLSSVLTHYVMSGETLIRIARRYDTTVKDIRRRNRIQGNLIRPGQKLRVAVGKDGRGRAIPGQSVGESDNGQLINGMQLPRGLGYYRRRPHRAWGANHTIFHIRRAISVVRSRFPKLHDLAIGDISERKGGKVGQHKSHQSGRDADIGFYFKKKPKGYPKSFVTGTSENLHMAATWTLLRVLADTAGSPSGIEKMFLDYDLQKLFYQWAKKRGVTKDVLDRIFQYPHGRGTARGVIRHIAGHSGHVHIRFKCPNGDKACKP